MFLIKKNRRFFFVLLDSFKFLVVSFKFKITFWYSVCRFYFHSSRFTYKNDRPENNPTVYKQLWTNPRMYIIIITRVYIA